MTPSHTPRTFTVTACGGAADGVLRAQVVEQPTGTVLVSVGALVWIGAQPAPATSVTLIGAPATLAMGARDRVAVKAVGLDPARTYLVRLTYTDHLGRTRDCNLPKHQTSAVFSGRTSHTEIFTVYGCAPGNGSSTAGLRLIADDLVELHPPIAIAPRRSVTITMTTSAE